MHMYIITVIISNEGHLHNYIIQIYLLYYLHADLYLKIAALQ